MLVFGVMSIHHVNREKNFHDGSDGRRTWSAKRQSAQTILLDIVDGQKNVVDQVCMNGMKKIVSALETQIRLVI